jgi:hypothetical protein
MSCLSHGTPCHDVGGIVVAGVAEPSRSGLRPALRASPTGPLELPVAHCSAEVITGDTSSTTVRLVETSPQPSLPVVFEAHVGEPDSGALSQRR